MMYLKRYRGSFVSVARFMKQGLRQHEVVEFQRAVVGTITFMGKDTLVKLKSPLIIFLPINFIIYRPTDRNLFTWFLSPQILPPLGYACSWRCSSPFGKSLKLTKMYLYWETTASTSEGRGSTSCLLFYYRWMFLMVYSSVGSYSGSKPCFFSYDSSTYSYQSFMSNFYLNQLTNFILTEILNIIKKREGIYSAKIRKYKN